MSYEFGDVVLVPFPFTNQVALKRRPAVIVSSSAYNHTKPDIVLMPITSQLRFSPDAGDVWVVHWQQAGLTKTSAIKPIFATLEQALIIRKLGTLDGLDQTSLKEFIAGLLR